MRDAGELDAVELGEHGREAQRAVAAQQRLLAARFELAGELVGRAELVLRDPLHAAGHRAVERVVDLVAARVDRRDDERPAVAQRVREQVEARDRDHRDPQRLREDLRGRHADAQPGEHAGPDADRDRRQVVERDPGLLADVLDRGREHFGVTGRVAPTAPPSSTRPSSPCSDASTTPTRRVAVSIPSSSIRSPAPGSRRVRHERRSDVARAPAAPSNAKVSVRVVIGVGGFDADDDAIGGQHLPRPRRPTRRA